jgi:hypothetical protein
MRRAMILSVFAYAPMAALVLRFHGLGLPGIWIALALWLAARSALLGRRWIAAAAAIEFPLSGNLQHEPRNRQSPRAR